MAPEGWGGLAAILLLAVITVLYYKGRIARIKESKTIYEKALKSGNKEEALKAGRIYYERLRGGRLTIYDEQAITNDLSAMK
jgi:hypothetical protein